MISLNFMNRSINYQKKFPLNNVLSYFVESRRNKARGEMYTPPEMYRNGGTSHGAKHYVPKFRQLRGKKVLKLDLPDFEKMREKENDEDAIRDRLKEMGLPPMRNTSLKEVPYFLPSSMDIFDRYLPRDGIVSSLVDKVKAPKEAYQDLISNRTDKSVKAIKNADPEFNQKTFGEQALRVYIEAHKALQERDKDFLHESVTEYAFPLMWDELKLKTLRWEFLRSLEAPRVVHVRANYMSKEDPFYGQVTVRMHSQQKLAVFDQFGRLFMGSEDVARDVLEYVVFERFLSDKYGKWRLHAKIPLSDSTPPSVSRRTYNLDVSAKTDADKTYTYAEIAKYDEEKDEKKS